MTACVASGYVLFPIADVYQPINTLYAERVASAGKQSVSDG
jgi:hypothetical protein